MRPSAQPAAATPLRSSCGGHRRPGVVLILVVAVLAMLFVAGAALLNSVTFSARTLDAAKADRQNQAAVQGIENVIFDLMRRGFLGPDGRPYNASTNGLLDNASTNSLPTSPSRVVEPMYGEIPGVNTWLDLTEPEEEGPSLPCKVRMYSHLPWAMQGRASVDPFSESKGVNDPDGSLIPIELHQINAMPGNSAREPFQIMDADGDGIPDSYAMPIPDEVLSPELRRALADRLRDPAVVNAMQNPTFTSNNQDFDPDALWLAVKVVSHGAMVNVNSRLPVCDAATWVDPLLASVLGEDPRSFFLLNAPGLSTTPYLPESTEWALRNRGGDLVPRTLLPPISSEKTRMVADFESWLHQPHQGAWWQYDPASLGDYNSSSWRKIMDALSGKGAYDLNHLLTTVSHDDQLIRSGLDGVSGSFEWTGYPFYLAGTGDPRLGRLKFSFPYFSKSASEGGAFSGNPRVGALAAPDKQRLIRTIQDGFLLLLRAYTLNGAPIVNFDGSGGIDAADGDAMSLIAASLTANLLDFADLDGQPTRVDVRSWVDGQVVQSGGEPVRVYGIERQPYITELYVKLTGATDPPNPPTTNPAQTTYAIELFNPYDVPLSLSGYSLKDVGSPTKPDTTPSMTLVQLNETLSGSIPPRSFQVYYSDGLQTPATTVLPGGQNSAALGGAGGTWFFDHASRIQLVRTVGTDKVVVDEFHPEVDSVTTPVTEVKPPEGIGSVLELSWSRDSSWRIATPNEQSSNPTARRSNWRFVVPLAKETPGGGSLSLGKSHVIESPSIRPVHVDCANVESDLLRDAFPTTGSLLLLMRHANVIDRGQPTADQATPFNRVGESTGAAPLMAREFDQIDNGRMPVFDDAGRYRMAPSATRGDLQGIEALPWGQLVFDYFTALPLNGEDACDPLPPLRRVAAPPVDQDGLRVSGRININAAPWPVIAGLPLMPLGDNADSKKHFGFYALPLELKEKIEAVYPGGAGGFPATRYTGSPINTSANSRKGQPIDIGRELAQAIVAYRDARTIPAKGGIPGQSPPYDSFAKFRGPTGDEPIYRRGYGFLTVGELLNVRPRFTGIGTGLGSYSFDRQAVQNPDGDYVTAVALMVALGDWVTTKSHVFTIYGTIRGQFYHDANDAKDNSGLRAESLRVVDQKAIRFQTTVDRLPMLFGADKPTRIGSLIVGPYADLAGE